MKKLKIVCILIAISHLWCSVASAGGLSRYDSRRSTEISRADNDNSQSFFTPAYVATQQKQHQLIIDQKQGVEDLLNNAYSKVKPKAEEKPEEGLPLHRKRGVSEPRVNQKTQTSATPAVLDQPVVPDQQYDAAAAPTYFLESLSGQTVTVLVVSEGGQILTMLEDSEKRVYYDADNLLERVEYKNTDKIIYYTDGLLSKVIDTGTTYLYSSTASTSAGGVTTYAVSLNKIQSLNNSYFIENNNITNVVLSNGRAYSFPYEYTPTLKADFDRNGRVEFRDFQILLDNWQLSNKNFSEGDSNSNGRVEFADFQALLDEWGKAESEPAAIALPGAMFNNDGTLKTNYDFTGMAYFDIIRYGQDRKVIAVIKPNGIEIANHDDFMDGLILVVTGSEGNDNIRITQDASGITLTTASVGSQTFTVDITAVEIHGGAGNDTITASYGILVPVRLYGGDGNDSLYANNASGAELYGEAGDDLLVSINGRVDTLIGGGGLDGYWNDDEDVVVTVDLDEATYNTVHSVSQFYQPFATDISKYISLNIAGQNLPDPLDSGITTNFSSYSLFEGAPLYNDIKQGSAGDCYFLSALASLAQNETQRLQQSIAPLGDGTFGVRFYSGGTPIYYPTIVNGQTYYDNTVGYSGGVVNYLRIDADLPVSSAGSTSLRFAKRGKEGELWVPLLEKAYAFFRNYAASVAPGVTPAAISYLSQGINKYSSLWTGTPKDLFNQVVNSGVTYVDIFTNSGVGPTYILSDIQSALNIQTALASGHAVTASSIYVSPAGLIPGTPIMGSHAYMVQSVAGTMVTLYDPWGSLVTISIEQYKLAFRETIACGIL